MAHKHQCTTANTRLEYKLQVDANRVCLGIHKVRVRPATRSAVSTQCIAEYNGYIWVILKLKENGKKSNKWNNRVYLLPSAIWIAL